MSQKSRRSVSLPFGSLPVFGDVGEPSMAGLQRLAESNMKFVQQWGEAWAKFMAERFDSDQAFMGRMAECRDLATATKLQAEWASKAMGDYMAEGQTLAELARRQAAEAFALPSRAAPKAGPDAGA
jgi:hypothetical protein